METRVGPKVGYLLPTRERVMQGKPAAVPLLQLAERAESLGFDSIWIGDSLIDRPRHEPLVMLAAVAARTKRVSLGTGVLLPALRNPVQLAQQAATLDQISEGATHPRHGYQSGSPWHPRRIRRSRRTFRKTGREGSRMHAAVPCPLDRRGDQLGRALAA